MELRDIEIFLTLAEELHFGRTAERLHVTPSRVSQSIRKQERRIGAPLFERTSRTVRLTPAGEHLRREVGAGYRRILDGIDAVSVAARGVSGTLRLGTMGPMSHTIGDVLELFASRHPAATVEHREIQPPAPLDLLRSGDVDVAHVWLPVDEPDLTVGPTTHTSPFMVMVAATDPLAARGRVSLDDLVDHPLVSGLSTPPEMEDSLAPRRTPSGRRIPRGPAVHAWHELLTLVSSGRASAGVSAEAAAYYAWPSLAFVPVDDAPPCRWALVWRTANETALVRAFAETAAALRERDVA